MKSIRFTLYLCFLWSAAAFAQSSVEKAAPAPELGSSATATAEIEHLMQAFHRAVAAHDGASVSSLFVDEGSTWFNVLSDVEYTRARARNPAALKVRHSDYQSFVKFVLNSHASLDPQHSDVQIHTDGTIASAYFHFVFVIDGKPENRGDETWQLIKTSNGWKIAAITYSSDPKRPGE